MKCLAPKISVFNNQLVLYEVNLIVEFYSILL